MSPYLECEILASGNISPPTFKAINFLERQKVRPITHFQFTYANAGLNSFGGKVWKFLSRKTKMSQNVGKNIPGGVHCNKVGLLNLSAVDDYSNTNITCVLGLGRISGMQGPSGLCCQTQVCFHKRLCNAPHSTRF